MNLLHAPPGSIGCDTSWKLDAPKAAALVSAGMRFVARYVPLHAGSAAAALDRAELELLTAAGLGVQIVQYGRVGDWTAETGRADGAIAAHAAAAAGAPEGMLVWMDLEGVLPSVEATIAYANAWAAACLAGGMKAGLYVGAGVLLDSEQLFHALAFKAYWRGLSQVPNVAGRGYRQLQLWPENTHVGGVEVDLDVTQMDYLGGVPVWIVA